MNLSNECTSMMTKKRRLPNKERIILSFGVAVALFALVRDELNSPLLYHHLRNIRLGTVYLRVPAHIAEVQRRLATGCGLPEHAPNSFKRTIIASFPSDDKTHVFSQVEALTGLPGRDEWEFEFEGRSDHPLINANYPHHEGIWGWGNVAQQSVLMIPNLQRALSEYHDVLWNIAKSASVGQSNSTAPSILEFHAWRDLRIQEELHRYGWFIDYWMEGGLMRDVSTHKATTLEHWNVLTMPTRFTREERNYDLVVGPNAVVIPSFDPHCAKGDVSGGCEVVAVVSIDRLQTYQKSFGETQKLLTALKKEGEDIVPETAWDCVWKERNPNGGFPKLENQRHFSLEMLEEMGLELSRLIDKYSNGYKKEIARTLVEILVEQRASLQMETNMINSGAYELTDRDFLGPKERERRSQLTPEAIDFFHDLEHKVKAKRLLDMRQERLERKKNTPTGDSGPDDRIDPSQAISDGESATPVGENAAPAGENAAPVGGNAVLEDENAAREMPRRLDGDKSMPDPGNSMPNGDMSMPVPEKTMLRQVSSQLNANLQALREVFADFEATGPFSS
mmetsp:Transcript_40628/g.69322  ORF Transcript_40628/g.69322 Transcript_40628/m.69322 type:complete len:564 (+) Transcript_40628:29-1720(+)